MRSSFLDCYSFFTTEAQGHRENLKHSSYNSLRQKWDVEIDEKANALS